MKIESSEQRRVLVDALEWSKETGAPQNKVSEDIWDTAKNLLNKRLKYVESKYSEHPVERIECIGDFVVINLSEVTVVKKTNILRMIEVLFRDPDA
ncbi:MAG: hypothetical protein GYB33_08650 [Gammaproteobacteria bacterium]|nr:hypothetical protein [Gammaproteobacteria bacterium]